jgi:hypothetical protein
VDQAWALENQSWEASQAGNGGQFYAQHMTTDGFIVVPGRTITRNELILRWPEREPLQRYTLSEPRMLLVDGESVLIAYSVSAHASWLPDYEAQVTALYTWVAGEWALAFRQHTPDSDTAFPF